MTPQRKPMPGGYRRNFTLIEIFMVLLIIGAVLTVMLPAVNRMLVGDAVTRGANLLSAGLAKVRAQAIVNRQETTITLFRDGFLIKDGVRTYFPGDCIIGGTGAQIDLDTAITVNNLFVETPITFASDGSTVSAIAIGMINSSDVLSGSKTIDKIDNRKVLELNQFTGSVRYRKP